MTGKRSIIELISIIFTCCSLVFFSSCDNGYKEGIILFTEVAEDVQNINYETGNSWRYFPNSRIVAYDPNKSEEGLKVLTEGFFSACSPQISYDAKFMLFSGQKEQHTPWQIWEMNLVNSKVRQITTLDENCVDPAYMPGDRFVFSKISKNDTIQKGHALFTGNLDGSNINQITFNPHTYFASSLLKDGRILTISRQLYPDQRNALLMVMRPDGSKEELFYRSGERSTLHSRMWETNEGKIYFIESDREKNNNGNIISVDYNRPLNTRVNLSSIIKGDFYALSPFDDERLLVSYRSNKNEKYALYEFDVENKTIGQAIFKDENFNILESVVIKKQERPKKLPSEVNMASNTGLLLCQDINFTGIDSADKEISRSKATKMEVMGMNSSLGTVNVEKDGSFYLKIVADTPFRLTTIDEDGNIVNGPGSWIYLRPNERRGCVGCHESNEQSPFNRQPLSIKKDPILLPNNIIDN